MKKYLMIGAALAALSGAAQAQDFDGGRVEARLGWETPTVSGDGDVYKLGSAVSYGGEVGYDLKAGTSVVVGPYATYEFSSVDLCDGTDCLSVDGNLGVGGRIGFIAGSNALIYGKVGYARITISADDGVSQGSTSKSGIQGALGLEMNFGKSLYGKIEGNYGDYGKLFGINLQRRQLAVGLGVRF
ncbi:MAG: porin family protein [Alphaproteobacteria bacterium]|nr:MAG: porin family protein [Alphaproteobacteria bacterium]